MAHHPSLPVVALLRNGPCDGATMQVWQGQPWIVVRDDSSGRYVPGGTEPDEFCVLEFYWIPRLQEQ
jgi:hypothetical protein